MDHCNAPLPIDATFFWNPRTNYPSELSLSVVYATAPFWNPLNKRTHTSLLKKFRPNPTAHLTYHSSRTPSLFTSWKPNHKSTNATPRYRSTIAHLHDRKNYASPQVSPN